MPADCQYLRVRLKTEQYRLLDWAHVARLSERDEDLLISQASKGLLWEVLHQQEDLLLCFGKYDKKLRKLTKPLLSDITDPKEAEALEQTLAYSSRAPTIVSSGTQEADADFETRFPQSESLLQKSLAWVRNRRKYPARLRWAAWDKEQVEDLLMKLTTFNDGMKEMLTGQQLQQLAGRQIRTEFQIVQLHNKMDQLIELFQSTGIAAAMGNRMYPWGVQALLQSNRMDRSVEFEPQTPGLQNLATLAQVKAMNSAIDSGTLTDATADKLAVKQSKDEIVSVKLLRKDIQLLDDANDDDRVDATYRNPDSKTEKRVWIEWKSYEPQSFGGGPDERLQGRIEALAALLKWNSHMDRFRAPHCLGYFLDKDEEKDYDHCRFGLVFEKPEGVAPQTKPRSLLELLDDPSFRKPSLTDRIALARAIAECVERLHAVNWLHKGLRSYNVLFFGDGSSGNDEIDLSKPYLSGFDYSRPVQREDLTEKPPENPAHDLYRHPYVQGLGPRDVAGSGRGYKKSYDIYSLGVILLEIVHWKSIDEILGIKDLRKVRPSTTRALKDRLLKEEDFLWYVKANVGNTMQGVVKACLQGPEAFGLKDGADEKDELVGEKLQREFYDKVVMKLESMSL